jgi:SAM-dependent methyltransferase
MQTPDELKSVLEPLGLERGTYTELYLSEAIFGWNELGPDIAACKRGLEIGAGPGLLAYMAARRTSADIRAVEPISEGFEGGSAILSRVSECAPANLEIIYCNLEDLPISERYDLIWSVNVLEHLPDWRAALLKIHALLAQGGTAILLFPNYDIPYEPHFRLPLIGGAQWTRKLFSTRIETHEAKNSAAGLWNSLNFVRASDVLRFAQSEGLIVRLDHSITVRMFERLADDGALSQRHRTLQASAAAVRFARLHRLWARLPSRLQPYLKLTLSRRVT